MIDFLIIIKGQARLLLRRRRSHIYLHAADIDVGHILDYEVLIVSAEFVLQ